jgi:hypothetical protein
VSLYRRNPRRDENEPAIRKAVEALGATWQPLSIPGGPDALIGFRGENLVMEVKQPKGKLRPSQEAWHARWRGAAVIVARTPAEAVAALLGHRVTLSRVLASEQAAAPAHVLVDEVGAYPTEGKAEPQRCKYGALVCTHAQCHGKKAA